MVFRFFPSALALLALTTTQVHGHGYLVKPVADFLSGVSDITQYSAIVTGTDIYPSGSFSGAPADNVASFITNFADGQYSDIKTLITDNQVLQSGATATCGFSDPSQNTHTLGTSVWWGKNTDLTGEGFVTSHEGPCEVWCDDTMLVQTMDCVTTYNKDGYASEIPFDNSACASASELKFYWLAMHTNAWQVYLNCLTLDGITSGSGSTTSSSTTTTSSSSTTTTTPTTTTATPTTTTATPTTTSSSSSSTTTTTTTPTTTTATPTTTTATPTTTTSSSSTSTTTTTTSTPSASSSSSPSSSGNSTSFTSWGSGGGRGGFGGGNQGTVKPAGN